MSHCEQTVKFDADKVEFCTATMTRRKYALRTGAIRFYNTKNAAQLYAVPH